LKGHRAGRRVPIIGSAEEPRERTPYAFTRHRGHGPDESLDLTQDDFARLLEKGAVATDPARGRFRSFLLADISFFLADRRDRDGAWKRGGGWTVLPIDARDADGRFTHELERPDPGATWGLGRHRMRRQGRDGGPDLS
jgi:hypothetical protein